MISIMHALGTFGDAGRARAVYIDALIMMDNMTGEQVFRGPLDELFRNFFGNPYAVIHRADLHGAYLEACRAERGITLVNNEKVFASKNTVFGAKVITAAGNVYEADAVIGADGINSKVRERLTGGVDPLRLSSHVAYRAVLPLDKMPEELRWNAATLWAGPKCHMVHYSLQCMRTFSLAVTNIFNTFTKILSMTFLVRCCRSLSFRRARTPGNGRFVIPAFPRRAAPADPVPSLRRCKCNREAAFETEAIGEPCPRV